MAVVARVALVVLPALGRRAIGCRAWGADGRAGVAARLRYCGAGDEGWGVDSPCRGEADGFAREQVCAVWIYGRIVGDDVRGIDVVGRSDRPAGIVWLDKVGGAGLRDTAGNLLH